MGEVIEISVMEKLEGGIGKHWGEHHSCECSQCLVKVNSCIVSDSYGSSVRITDACQCQKYMYSSLFVLSAFSA